MEGRTERLGDVLGRLRLRSSSGEGEGATAPWQGGEEARPPECPRCRGVRWVKVNVPFGHPRWGEIEPCTCWRQESREERQGRLLRYSNLGALTRFTFETLDPQGRGQDPEDQRLFRQAVEAARAFSEAPSGWLVLAGPSGCGKTHLAAALAHRAVEAGHAVLFMVVPDLLDHLRAAFGPSSEETYDLRFEQLCRASLLVLDDLGAQASTPWAREKLLQVLNYRYNMELPTVVTLAAPLEALEERLQTRLAGQPMGRVVALARPRPRGGRALGGMPEAMERGMLLDGFRVRGNRADQRQQGSLEAALKAASSFAGDPAGQWLVLIGPPGVGKTHLAAAIVNERRRQGQPTFFAFVPELLDHLRYTFAPTTTVAYDQLFEQVKDAPLLALDDLGSQSTTPWAEEKLYQLLVHRHNARLPTVITIQKGVQLSPAVTSRLSDARFVTALEMDAPDYRDQSQRPAPQRRGSRSG